jgi:hypothetical protein
MTPRWFGRRRRRPAAAAPSPYLLDSVAAAIAQAAGHNWHAAAMMPDYRAEFRRQAAAAIAAFRAAA